jgi:hypothetical protein
VPPGQVTRALCARLAPCSWRGRRTRQPGSSTPSESLHRRRWETRGLWCADSPVTGAPPVRWSGPAVDATMSSGLPVTRMARLPRRAPWASQPTHMTNSRYEGHGSCQPGRSTTYYPVERQGVVVCAPADRVRDRRCILVPLLDRPVVVLGKNKLRSDRWRWDRRWRGTCAAPRWWSRLSCCLRVPNLTTARRTCWLVGDLGVRPAAATKPRL